MCRQKKKKKKKKKKTDQAPKSPVIQNRRATDVPLHHLFKNISHILKV
jgi:hypothetical protein